MSDLPREESSKLNQQDDFEARLAEMTTALENEKREYYANTARKRAGRQAEASGDPEADEEDGSVRIDQAHQRIYAAARALVMVEERSRRREGAIHRTWRLVRGLKQARARVQSRPDLSAEKRRGIYRAVFEDAWQPVCDGAEDMVDTAWNFLAQLGRDSMRIGQWIGDFFRWLGYHLGNFGIWLGDRIWDLRYWAEMRKFKLLRWFTIAAALVVVGVVFNASTTAYEYSYYGKVLGLTRSKDDVYRTIDVLGDKLSVASGLNVSLDVERDIEFTKVRGIGMQIDSDDDILNTLTYMKDLQVYAYAVYVDGEPIVVLEDEETTDRVLNAILTSYMPEKEGVTYDNAEFEEEVTVGEVSVRLGEIWNPYVARDYLRFGNFGEMRHTVAVGETFAEIAATYQLSEAQLAAANPHVDPENLIAGQIITLGDSDPIVNVRTFETYIYNEDIEYKTRYIDNASIYEGETELKSAGVTGVRQMTVSIEAHNGVEVAREVVSTARLSEPVDEVMYRGTKEIPPRIGTGTFILPLRSYYVSSRFGWRWGRMHEGIDMAVNTGTKVYAADGGVCTYAGWKNGLGYCVYIDHGGLLTTVYAHCSKVLVSAGDAIYQGQNIALSGNTGRSTGPHLHLEVRYNGEAKNPEDYLDF